MNKHQNDRNLFKLFQQDVEIPASTQECLEHTYNEIRLSFRKRQDNNLRMHIRHHSKTVIIVAAVIVILSVSVLAVGLTHTEFIKSVFGNGIESREEWTIPKPRGSSEVYPASERVEVDTDSADSIIGSYIADVGTTVELEGYTFTIKSIVMDANGIACLTYTAENPYGLDIKDVYYYYKGEFPPFGVSFATTSGDPLDHREFIDSSLTTDTKATYVEYITPIGTVEEDVGIVMSISVLSELRDTKPAQATITIPASEKVSAIEFTNGDITADISPVGIRMKFLSSDTIPAPSYATSSKTDSPYPTPDWQEPSFDIIIHDLRIVYADGSEYVVESEDPYIVNSTVSSLSGQSVWTAFNRLVDVNNVTSVIVNGSKLTR